jgi:hypothetical protein
MPQIHRQHGRVVSSSGTPIPEGEEVPPIEFSEPEPPLEVCDQVLGGYIRCWGYVETAVTELFALLLGAHPIAARAVIASSMNPRTLREIMRVLARQRLSREQCATLERLLRRLDRATTSRNHIVHGTWRVAVEIKKPGPNTATWERFYEPLDPDAYEQMRGKRGSQKLAAKHVFSVDRIVQLAHDAHALAKGISDFARSASIEPFQDSHPIRFTE